MLRENSFSLLKVTFLVALSIVFFSSCVNYDQVEIKDIKEVSLVNFSGEGLIVDSKVKILNPNAFDIKVVDSELNIIVQGRPIGSAKIDGKVVLPSNSEEYHTLRLKSSFEDLGSNALANLLAITTSNTNKIDFKFEGFIVCKVFVFKRKVDISHEDSTVLKLF